MKRKLFLLLTLLVVALTLAACGKSQTPPGKRGEFRIDDEAKLFSADEKAQIEESVKELLTYGNVGVATRGGEYTLFGQTTAAFAAGRYNQWFGTDSGVLFVIDMRDRVIYLETDGYIGSFITRSKARTITDNTYRMASAANYYGCTTESLKQVLDVIEGRKISEKMSLITNAVLAALIGLLVNAFVLVRILQKPVVNVENAEHIVSGATIFSDVSVKEKSRKVREIYTDDGSGSRGFFGGGGGGGGGGHGSHGGGHGF